MKYEDILKNDWHLKRCGRGMVLKALQNACRKRRGTVVDSNRKMQPEASVEAPELPAARVVPPAWCDVAPYKDDPNDEEPESPSECPTIRDIRVKTAGSRAQSSAARSPSEASPKPVPHVSAPVPVDDTLGVCRNAVK